MIQPTQMDYGPHLEKLKQKIDNKLESADRFVQGYLIIVGINDAGVKAQTTTFPLSLSYVKGNEETIRTGIATYGLPDTVQAELNRAAAGYDPASKEIVNEIDRANRLGSNYTPDNEEVAAEFRKHFQRRNGSIPFPVERNIATLVEGN